MEPHLFHSPPDLPLRIYYLGEKNDQANKIILTQLLNNKLKSTSLATL